MHYQELTRISLGLWSIAALTTIVSKRIPDQADRILRLTIPAAITTGIVAIGARIVAAQEQHTIEMKAASMEAAAEISGHLDRVAIQVTEIARSDQNRLSFLRGVLSAHKCPGIDPGAGTPVHLSN
ncbi:hypothetical protein [Microbispora sp. GKU 823]|uniref:hypothetical protein n=1 Tax=Microbispora sp. GKU 823 TaxID=1652100 RepID=UPI0009A38348|nr:hypothetical protein [Microbispora sp. GKU 823]OPG13703.1 hypothetical protein B1L11_06870 [Microbispora sp. GKU 823]